MATTTDTESGEAMTGDRKAEVAALVKTIDGLYSQRSEGPWWQESWETPTPPAGAGRELSELLCHFSDEGKPRFWCWNTDGKLVVALENAWPIIRKSLMSQTTEGTMTAQVEAGQPVSREPIPAALQELDRLALEHFGRGAGCRNSAASLAFRDALENAWPALRAALQSPALPGEEEVARCIFDICTGEYGVLGTGDEADWLHCREELQEAARAVLALLQNRMGIEASGPLETTPCASSDSGTMIDLLRECQSTIRAQTNVGLLSQDPENEDPQHEFQELLTDLDDALAQAPEAQGAAPHRYQEGYVNGYRKGWTDAGGSLDD